MSRLILSELVKKKVRDLASQRKRVDGRGLNEIRKIRIERKVVPQADGSALVYLGATKAIAGVKIELGSPYPDTPDAGVLTVNVELMPLASPTFEPGPPDERAIEAARIVDRVIRESRMIDLEALAVIPGKEVYVVFIDTYVVDYDGNFIDACVLASVSALLDATMRKAVVKADRAVLTDERTRLPVRHYPTAITVAKIGETLFVDPSLEEEAVLDARITIGFDEEDRICTIQHSIGTLKYKELYQAINLSREAANKLRMKVKEVFSECLEGNSKA